jgi:hypothetical protein
VTYIGPPPPEFPTIQVTYFSYINCSGVLVNSDVGDGDFSPTSRNVCAQEGTITITGGDAGCDGNFGSPCATWDISAVNCCLSFFPSRISGTPEPINGCAATLDTDCWVSDITGTPGNETISSGSTVYLDPAGTIPFPGVSGDYKINITGSSKCTSSEVAPDGDVGGSIGICFSCP